MDAARLLLWLLALGALVVLGDRLLSTVRTQITNAL